MKRAGPDTQGASTMMQYIQRANGDGQALPGDPAGPSQFTPIKEQLGLELVAKKEPVEVVMIDSMERPTEN